MRLSVIEAADLMDVTTGTIREWDRQGLLPNTTRTQGGHRRILAHDLNKLRCRSTGLADIINEEKRKNKEIR